MPTLRISPLMPSRSSKTLPIGTRIHVAFDGASLLYDMHFQDKLCQTIEATIVEVAGLVSCW